MSGSALVAEPSAAVSAALRKILERAGLEVRTVTTAEAALPLLTADGPQLLFAPATGALDGHALCQKAKKARKELRVVLIYPPDVDDPEPSAKEAGADAFLVGPLKRGSVVSTTRLLLQLQAQAVELNALRAGGGDKSRKPPVSDDLAFLKRLLLMEVKRSRRYRYPVSFLLLGLDKEPEKTKPDGPGRQGTTVTLLLEATARGLRDIDLAVPSGAERVLIFLPHTGAEGAKTVSDRLRSRFEKAKSEEGLTLSIGICSYEPMGKDDQVSFGTLLEAATRALKNAQREGGNRVEVETRRTRSRSSSEAVAE